MHFGPPVFQASGRLPARTSAVAGCTPPLGIAGAGAAKAAEQAAANATTAGAAKFLQAEIMFTLARYGWRLTALAFYSRSWAFAQPLNYYDTPAMKKKPPASAPPVPRHGVARVISKLGIGSRTQAARWVREGRVRVNGIVVSDAEFPVMQGRDLISVDSRESASPARLVVMLNKPRGLVTTTRDERGRDTVYKCFEGAALPWLAPVGRLDKASEGLLLFSNDPAWAARITDPTVGPEKTYHVQVNRLPDAALLADLQRGAVVEGERLAAKTARCVRTGERHAWLEIVLDEGRNRHIRRLLAALDVSVLRLVRVAVGSLSLGELPKGGWRKVTEREMDGLTALQFSRCSIPRETSTSPAR
jgi:23S rRNA pseudouridine2605 synthase